MSSKNHRGFVTAAFAVCVMASSLPSSAWAVDLSNNLSDVNGGTESASSTRWLAASFATGTAAHALNYVTLLLANTSAGAAQVSIYSNGGLEPGSLVATLTSPASYSATLAPTAFTTAGVNLAANTTYWIVLRPTSGTFLWGWTGDNTGSGAGFQHTWGISEDSGAFWWSFDTYPTQFSVTVDACTAATVSAHPQPVNVRCGGMASFGVTAAGSATISYAWRHNSMAVSNSSRISGATTVALNINGVIATDAGPYDVVVTNGCGSAMSNPAALGISGFGDFDGDGLINGDDLQPFVNCLIVGGGANCACADVDGDGVASSTDVPPLIAALLVP